MIGEDNIITILPDDNKKYISTDLAVPIHSEFVDKIQLLDFSIVR